MNNLHYVYFYCSPLYTLSNWWRKRIIQANVQLGNSKYKYKNYIGKYKPVINEHKHR